jgi:hypothetical protein
LDTFTAVVAVLFPGTGSVPGKVTVAALLICVLSSCPQSRVTVSVKAATSLTAIAAAFVHVTTPAATSHDQPAGELTEASVTPEGNASVQLTVVAVVGPKFVTTTV